MLLSRGAVMKLLYRLTTTAENFGVRVKLVKESYTSSICPRCSSDKTIKYKRLFKCLDCGLEAHRDVVGAINIARLSPGGTGGSNGGLALPELPRLHPSVAQTSLP